MWHVSAIPWKAAFGHQVKNAGLIGETLYNIQARNTGTTQVEKAK
jgi:hypothetical protein